MLDIKRIRQNPEALVEAMRKRRNKGADVTALLELDAKRREVMQEVEQLKAKRNEGSARVPAMKKAGADVAATGENAVVVACRKADVIVGPVACAIADSLWGEITPAMAAAVGGASAKRVLVPFNHCNNVIVGVADLSVSELIRLAMAEL